MPRKNPIDEMQSEEAAQNASPLRRSSRISLNTNSLAPAAKVTGRRSSAQAIDPVPAPRTRRRSHDIENLEKARSKSPTTTISESETKGVSTPAKATRGRRSSATKAIEDDKDMPARVASPTPMGVTTRRRSIRGVSASPSKETPEKSEPAKPRGRRASVTDKVVPMEAIEETDGQVSKKPATKTQKSSTNLELIEEQEDKPSESPPKPAKRLSLRNSIISPVKEEIKNKSTVKEEADIISELNNAITSMQHESEILKNIDEPKTVSDKVDELITSDTVDALNTFKKDDINSLDANEEPNVKLNLSISEDRKLQTAQDKAENTPNEILGEVPNNHTQVKNIVQEISTVNSNVDLEENQADEVYEQTPAKTTSLSSEELNNSSKENQGTPINEKLTVGNLIDLDMTVGSDRSFDLELSGPNTPQVSKNEHPNKLNESGGSSTSDKENKAKALNEQLQSDLKLTPKNTPKNQITSDEKLKIMSPKVILSPQDQEVSSESKLKQNCIVNIVQCKEANFDVLKKEITPKRSLFCEKDNNVKQLTSNSPVNENKHLSANVDRVKSPRLSLPNKSPKLNKSLPITEINEHHQTNGKFIHNENLDELDNEKLESENEKSIHTSATNNKSFTKNSPNKSASKIQDLNISDENLHEPLPLDEVETQIATVPSSKQSINSQPKNSDKKSDKVRNSFPATVRPVRSSKRSLNLEVNIHPKKRRSDEMNISDDKTASSDEDSVFDNDENNTISKIDLKETSQNLSQCDTSLRSDILINQTLPSDTSDDDYHPDESIISNEDKQDLKSNSDESEKSDDAENSLIDDDEINNLDHDVSLSKTKRALRKQKFQSINDDDDEEEDGLSLADFFDDEAMEGTEDTPSEDSNEIPCEGESINSNSMSEGEEEEDSYDDSFIDDDGNQELLSGDETYLDSSSSPTKSKRKRIIDMESSSEDEIDKNLSTSKDAEVIEITTDAVKIDENNKSIKGRTSVGNNSKILSEDVFETSKDRIENTSLSKKGKLKSPKTGIIISAKPTEEEGTNFRKPILNKEDNLKSLEELQNEIKSKDKNKRVSFNEQLEAYKDENNSEKISLKTPRNSVSDIICANDVDSSKTGQISAVIIRENLNVNDLQENNIKQKFSKVLDAVCSELQDGDNMGNVSLNISLDYKPTTDAQNRNSFQPSEVPNKSTDVNIADIELKVTAIKPSKPEKNSKKKKGKHPESPVSSTPIIQNDDDNVFKTAITKAQNLNNSEQSKKKKKKKSAKENSSFETKPSNEIAEGEKEPIKLVKNINLSASDFEKESAFAVYSRQSKQKESKTKEKKKSVKQQPASTLPQEETSNTDVKKKRKKSKDIESWLAEQELSPTSKKRNKNSEESESEFEKFFTDLEQNYIKEKKRKTGEAYLSEQNYSYNYDNYGENENIEESTDSKNLRMTETRGRLKNMKPRKSKSLEVLTDNKRVNMKKSKKREDKCTTNFAPAATENSWKQERLRCVLKPTTSEYVETKKDEKDFKNNMLFNPSRVRRMDTKKLLRNRNCF